MRTTDAPISTYCESIIKIVFCFLFYFFAWRLFLSCPPLYPNRPQNQIKTTILEVEIIEIVLVSERNGKEVYTNNHPHDHERKKLYILLKNEINQSKNIDGFKMNYENWMDGWLAGWLGPDRADIILPRVRWWEQTKFCWFLSLSSF